MPSKFRLRPIFAPIVKIIAKILIKINITPNIATFMMLTSAIISVLGLIILKNVLWFGIWIFITGLLDGVDGAIARLSGKGSRFGGFLDSVMDRISEPIIYLGFFFERKWLFNRTDTEIFILIWAMITSSFIISYTRARAEIEARKIGEKIDSNVGLLGRSERLFYLVILTIVSYFYATEIQNLIIFYGLILFTILVAGTALYRILYYKKELERFTNKK